MERPVEPAIVPAENILKIVVTIVLPRPLPLRFHWN